jgi:hypothetical protein
VDKVETLEKTQWFAVEQIQVSYSVLPAHCQFRDFLQKFATAINVQLSLERDQELPFVSFTGYDTAEQANKLFLFGPSGCGKSRSIFEILKSKMTVFEKVYIINPRNTTTKDSGRISVFELINKIGENDALVWDNFPDDLIKRDFDTAKEVLEIISSKNLKGLFIALKPEYLEPYRGLVSRIPEYNNCEVFYEKERFRDILKTYGTTIPRFKKIYQRYIEDELSRISGILWQKEATPLTVLDYYRDLMRVEDKSEPKIRRRSTITASINKGKEGISYKSPITGAIYAEKLLRRSDYYQHQFELMARMEERRGDREFLYTLKLCYELGLNRTRSFIEKLQSGIFDSKPLSEPLENLSTWVYPSGTNYAMHDVQKDAVKFNIYVKSRTLTYLIDNFEYLISRMQGNHNSAFGQFIGKNIDVIPHQTFYLAKPSLQFSLQHHPPLPDNICRYMKSNTLFEFSLGQGVGEIFHSLEAEFQQEIIKTVEQGLDVEFIRGLSSGLGHNFSSLDRAQQRDLLRMINAGGVPFARFFGESLGRVFKYLSKELQEQIFKLMKRSGQFADGIGMGLGYVFPTLDSQMQEDFFERARTHTEFTRGLGYGLALNYLSLDKELQEYINSKIMTDGEFAKGLAMGFGFIFGHLTENFRKRVFDLTAISPKFAFGLGIYLQFVSSSSSLDEQLQKEIQILAGKNSEFGYGTGVGLSYLFGYQSKEYQDALFEKAEKETHFAFGFGMGFGFLFKNLPAEQQDIVLEKAERNSEFAKGLGSGFDYVFPDLPREYQDALFEKAERNSEFAKGLGMCFGYLFVLHEQRLQDIVLEKAERNSEFAFGLGYGLGYIFPYLQEEYINRLYVLIEKNIRLAQGLASGIGYGFMYLQKGYQDALFEKAERNSEFAFGLGYGLGHIFQYLSNSFKKELLARTSSRRFLSNSSIHGKFTRGLGVGLGYTFMYLTTLTQKELFAIAAKSPEFANGLGEGIGRIYPHGRDFLEKSLLNVNTGEATTTEEGELSKGFGLGIGQIFKYLGKETQEKALREASHNPQFANGLGEGIGSIFNYFDKGVQNEIFERAHSNNDFSNGLGFGLASVFSYLQYETQEKIVSEILLSLPPAQTTNRFSKGFGLGIGQIFKYLGKEIQDNFLTNIAEKNTEYAAGLGEGFGRGFNYWSFDFKESRKMIKLADKNLYIAIGLSQGLARYMGYLDEQTQKKILKVVEQNPTFSKYFYKKTHENSNLVSRKYHTNNSVSDILFLIRSLSPNKTTPDDTFIRVPKKYKNQENLDISKKVDIADKKVTITLSIDDAVLQMIRGDAERDRMSINAKVNNILSRYTACYKHAEKDQSLIVPSVIMREILNEIDEQVILKEYRDIIFDSIPSILLENMISPLTLENWISHACNTTMVFAGLIESLSVNKDKDGLLSLVFIHSYGIKWSRILDTIVSQYMNDILKQRTISTILPNSIVIRIL